MTSMYERSTDVRTPTNFTRRVRAIGVRAGATRGARGGAGTAREVVGAISARDALGPPKSQKGAQGQQHTHVGVAHDAMVKVREALPGVMTTPGGVGASAIALAGAVVASRTL